MRVRILQIIACIFFVFVISQHLSFSDTQTCQCEFDTDEYEATGYFGKKRGSGLHIWHIKSNTLEKKRGSGLNIWHNSI